MIDHDRVNAVTIINSLAPEQIRYIAQLTGQGDVTLRQYAAEVFNRLLETTSWPHGPSQQRALEIFNTVVDVLSAPQAGTLSKIGVAYSQELNVYNMVVAVGFADCNIGIAARGSILSAMKNLAPQLADGDQRKASQKINTVIVGLQHCI